MTTLKIDFHVHTNHSDSISSVEKIIGAARQKRLDGIAITDHETTSAFAQATKLAPDLIIILGMEVETMEGHILILGVEDVPPKGLSAVEVAEYARQKGGVVIIPHPNIFFINIREDVIKRIRPDAIETYNAGIPFFWHYKKKNIELAQRLGLPQTGGSDSHSYQTVGDMYTVVDADSRSVETVLEAVRAGRIQPYGRASPLREKIKTTVYAVIGKFHIIRKWISLGR